MAVQMCKESCLESKLGQGDSHFRLCFESEGEQGAADDLHPRLPLSVL
jgi:hypothetical protein